MKKCYNSPRLAQVALKGFAGSYDVSMTRMYSCCINLPGYHVMLSLRSSTSLGSCIVVVDIFILLDLLTGQQAIHNCNCLIRLSIAPIHDTPVCKIQRVSDVSVREYILKLLTNMYPLCCNPEQVVGLGQRFLSTR